MQFDNPLIIQSDRTILLDVHAPRATECQQALIPFAELERSPEHLHTYRLTPLSLWNATSAGFTPEDAVAVLKEYARYDVPQSIEVWIQETAGRFGKLHLLKSVIKKRSMVTPIVRSIDSYGNECRSITLSSADKTSSASFCKPKSIASSYLIVSGMTERKMGRPSIMGKHTPMSAGM